jgi:hypothetical protein
MATTTNYGWTTPDDTALVKDGAAAIRTLGSSVDTTTKNLNPSTTLGDIEYRSSTANVNTRLGIGSTGNVLTVAGGVPTWAAPASSGALTKIKSATFSAVSSFSFDANTFSSTYDDYYVLFTLSSVSAGTNITARLRASGSDDTNSNYMYMLQRLGINGTQYNSVLGNGTSFNLGDDTTGSFTSFALTFLNPKLTVKTKILGTSSGVSTDGNVSNSSTVLIFNDTTAFDSFTIISGTGTITGRYAIYGLEK